MLPIHAPYGAFFVFGSGTRRLPCGQYELVCCAIGFANTRNGMAMCSPPTRGLRAYAMHGKRALKRPGSSPSPNQSRPLCVRFFPLSKSTTPALAGVISPSHVINARFAGVISSSHVINARAGGRHFPLAIYGEGVADRPGERSLGLGKMPSSKKKSLPKKNFLTPPTTTRISRPRRRDETSPWHDENRKEESDREI